MHFESRYPESRLVDKETLEIFSRVAGWTGRFAAQRVRRILGDSLHPGKTALDIGTGPGTIPVHLERLFPGTSIIGLDISFDMLKKAKIHCGRKNTDLPLVLGDGEVLPFKKNSMDVVMSFFSMHHMDQPEILLKEINRVLKPEGKLLIIDFRRDMPRALFLILDTLWQTIFFFSDAKLGFRNSVRSAWRPGEIEIILMDKDLKRFGVNKNPAEFFVISG